MLKEMRVKSQLTLTEIVDNGFLKLWILNKKTVEILAEQGLSKYLLQRGCALYSDDQLAAPHDVGAVRLLALLTYRETSVQKRRQECTPLDGVNFGQSKESRKTIAPWAQRGGEFL